MPTQEQIAAATIAQLFGSELFRVDQNTIGSVPNAVKIDPKAFLTQNANTQVLQKQQEQKLVEELNREAELAYPRAEPLAPVQPIPQKTQASKPIIREIHAPSEFQETLTKVNLNLERIASALESLAKIDKKQKRSILKTT